MNLSLQIRNRYRRGPFTAGRLGALSAGCPAIDPAAKLCDIGLSDPISCTLIRECDERTGTQHVEYALPNAVNNPNQWVLNADNSYTWTGPNPRPSRTPTLDFAQTPNPYDDPRFYVPPTATATATPTHTTTSFNPNLIGPNLRPAPAVIPPPVLTTPPLNPRLMINPLTGLPLTYGGAPAAYRPDGVAQPQTSRTPSGSSVTVTSTNTSAGNDINAMVAAASARAVADQAAAAKTAADADAARAKAAADALKTAQLPISAGAATGILRTARDLATDIYNEADGLIPDVPGWAILAGVAALGTLAVMSSRKR